MMNEYKVWKRVKLNEVPKDKHLVKCKWVFLVKRNGTFRSRLVACGYTQIPGEDFAETYSPVIHDSTFRILLVMKMLMKLDHALFDVQVAF